jgi:DNA-3-methyladenine glycosylase II
MTELPRTFTITPDGAFSLIESVRFGFGQRAAEPWAGVMRLAFCLDDLTGQAGVELRQHDGVLTATVTGDGPLEAIRTQVARVLSVDRDARGFTAIGERDPVLARLQRAAPGLRPPLFYSPYEAAVWAVLSLRRPARQMVEVRRRLSEAHGRSFVLAGQQLAALPTPQQVLALDSFPGIPTDRIPRLHGVARAALDGLLAVDRLQALGPDEARSSLQQIKGIGPFYSELIVVRAVGFVDVLPRNEPLLLELIRRNYGLATTPDAATLDRISESWRPWRTWAAVLLRAATDRPAVAADREATDRSRQDTAS